MEDKKKKESIKLRFNLRSFIGLCLSKWPMFVVSVIACVAVAAFLIMRRVPSVEVDAQVMLPQETASTSLLAEMSRSFSFGDVLGSSSTTDNELDVMRSHSVFLSTVKDLGLATSVQAKAGLMRWLPLYNNVPLTVKAPSEFADTVTAPIVFKLSRNSDNLYDIEAKCLKKTVYDNENVKLPVTADTPYGSFTIAPTEWMAKCPFSKFIVTLTSYDNAAEMLAQDVSIFIPNKKSDFIGLSVMTTDADFGKQLLTTIIKNYNQIGIDHKGENDSRTLGFVNARLESLTGELAKSESDIERFKAANNITEPEADVQVLLEKSSKLDGAMLDAQTQHEILAMTYAFVKDPANDYALIPVIPAAMTASQSSGTTTSGIDKYNELVLERMKLLSSAKGNNAALKAIDDQLDALHANIVSSVERAYKNSKVMLDEVTGMDSETKSRIGSVPAIEREYLSLKRVQLVQEQLYLFLLKQREEVSMSMARANPTVTTIDAPHALTLTGPLSNMKLLAIAVLLGLLIPMAYVFTRLYHRGAVADSRDFADISSAPVLGSLGKMGADTASAADDGDALRKLRSRVKGVLDDCGGTTLAVTSPADGDGKTRVATALAQSMALTGKRVLLMDADMRHPAVARELQLKDAPGLSGYLMESGDGSEVTVNKVAVAGGRSLDVITGGAPTALAPDLVGGDNMRSLMARLKSRYDYIVIDCESLGGHSDVLDLAAVVDMTLVVFRTGATTTAQVETVNSLCENGELPRMAVVVNEVDKR